MSNRDTEHQKNYGEKIQYSASWQGPLYVERSVTDQNGLIAPTVFVFLWLIMGIYSYSAGQMSKISYSVQKSDKLDVSFDDWSPSITTCLAAKNIIIGYVILSGGLTLSFIILLRWHTKFIVYTSIFILITIALTLIIYRFISDANEEGKYMRWARGGFSLGIILVALAYLFTQRQRIPIACQVIKESIEVIVWFPVLIIHCVLQFIAYFIVLAYSVMIFIALVKIPILSSEQGKEPTVVLCLILLAFALFNLFAFLWMWAFIGAYARMILYCTFSSWYWTLDKKFVPENAVKYAAKVTTRYHLGTLAWGSLITATCRLFLVMSACLEDSEEDCQNATVCCCLCWSRHLFAVVEDLARIANNNAYIMCASHGTNFISSAKSAFNLIMRNAENALIVDDVTQAILYVGQLLAVGTALGFTYITCVTDENLKEKMGYVIALVAVCSVLLVHVLFEVLGAAMNTLFLSSLEDFERNDGSESRPYYMSSKLKMLLLQSRFLTTFEC